MRSGETHVDPAMEPRQLWDRNAVLAEAFCRSDENVRDVQGTLDDAQAVRSRMLAAFAVTVRNDGAVADLLGLTEREVRIARRTVGKEDARAVADELLAAPAASAPPAEEQHTVPVPDACGYVPGQQPQQQQPPPPVPGTGTETVWSAAIDAVLVGGWQTGVDLQVLAAEFGLDLSRLVTRAQQLSVQGRLGPYRGAYAAEEAAGRHRRGSGAMQTDPYGIPTQQPASGWDVAGVTDPTQVGWPAAVGQAWGPDAHRMYAGEGTGTHDWDGILHEWGDNPAMQENPVQAAGTQQGYPYQHQYQQPWPQYT